MEVPTSEALMKPISSSESLIKPVPKPFSIEALMSDTGPRRMNPTAPSWSNIFSPSVNQQNNIHNLHHHHHHHHQHSIGKDTDSDGSLDMDIVQDLSSSRRCEKDGEFGEVCYIAELNRDKDKKIQG